MADEGLPRWINKLLKLKKEATKELSKGYLEVEENKPKRGEGKA